MGQFTEAYVNICVANSQKAEELFAHLQEMNDIVTEKYQGDSNYYDHEIFHGKEFSEIRIQFSSGRYQNCEWQGEILIAESLPYYKEIIEFEFNIPNCESYWVGDEPEEWEEGGSFYKIAQRIEKSRIDYIKFLATKKLPKISLRSDLEPNTGVPVKFVDSDVQEQFITSNDGIICLMNEFEEDEDGFNIQILVGGRKALAASVDFDFPKQIKTKSYLSIYDFIESNDLKEEAKKLFGEVWEAESDIEMAQNLCDHLKNGVYVVVENTGQIHEDNEFEILERR